MMNELRNVLTVRTTNKTLSKEKQPRRSKHSKKKGPQTTNTLLTDNITPPCDPSSLTLSHTSLQCNNSRNSISTGDIQHGVPCDTHGNTQYDMLEDRDMLLQDANPLFMKQVATMAARIAMNQSTLSHQQEEVFGGNDEDQ